jgi:ethanolamine utilization protein EutN
LEIGKVIGNVWATKKDEGISGQKLLVVNIRKHQHQKRDSLLVAADIIGAGIGDLVLVSKGNSARQAVGDTRIPVDAAIIGIIDSLELNESDSDNDGGI